MPDSVVPYDLIVDLGVLSRRVNDAFQELASLDEDLGHMIEQCVGDQATDQFLEEFSRDVDRRIEGSDAC